MTSTPAISSGNVAFTPVNGSVPEPVVVAPATTAVVVVGAGDVVGRYRRGHLGRWWRGAVVVVGGTVVVVVVVTHAGVVSV